MEPGLKNGSQNLAQVSAEADSEFLFGIISPIVKAVVKPLIGADPYVLKFGGVHKDKTTIASDTDPVYTYISTHKHKPEYR